MIITTVANNFEFLKGHIHRIMSLKIICLFCVKIGNSSSLPILSMKTGVLSSFLSWKVNLNMQEAITNLYCRSAFTPKVNSCVRHWQTIWLRDLWAYQGEYFNINRFPARLDFHFAYLHLAGAGGKGWEQTGATVIPKQERGKKRQME